MENTPEIVNESNAGRRPCSECGYNNAHSARRCAQCGRLQSFTKDYEQAEKESPDYSISRQIRDIAVTISAAFILGTLAGFLYGVVIGASLGVINLSEKLNEYPNIYTTLLIWQSFGVIIAAVWGGLRVPTRPVIHIWVSLLILAFLCRFTPIMGNYLFRSSVLSAPGTTAWLAVIICVAWRIAREKKQTNDTKNL